MTIVMPTVLLILIPFLFKPIMLDPSTNTQSMKFVLKNLMPGLICLPTFILGFIGVPTVYGVLKETGMLKRVNVAGIKPWHFLVSLVSVFIVLTFISSLWLYTLSTIIWRGDVPIPNGGLFIIPYIMLIIISLIIGVTISNVSRSQASAFAMGIMIFLPTLFLSGILFSKFTGWTKYVSWFVPNTGFLNLFKISWGEGTLNFASNSLVGSPLGELTWMDNAYSTVFAFIYPSAFSTIAKFICIKKFKFE